MSESDEYDGPDRRDPVALDPATLAILTSINKSISKNAEAMTQLADALTKAVLRQGRGIRLWQYVLTAATLVLVGLSISARYERSDTAKVVAEVHDCVSSDGECSKRQAATADAYVTQLAAKFQSASDENRKKLAIEIVCYVGAGCPPGMTKDNIPDLQGLTSETGTTTTTQP